MLDVNPLGYFCAPNEADASYAACQDIEQFIAYGFIRSHLSHLYITGDLVIRDEDTQWLREGFLRCVEIAADMMPNLSRGDQADMGSHGTGVTLYPPGWDRDSDKSPDSTCLDIEWRVDMRGSDGVLSLALVWNDGNGCNHDSLAIFVNSNVFNNRLRVAKAIAHARIVNGLKCVITEMDRRLVLV